jgi:hypothetical protein
MRKVMYGWHCVVWIVAGLCSIAVAGKETPGRTYVLPDHGSLQIKPPAGWKDEVKQPPNRMPPTITFSPREGAPFQVLITPIWTSRKDAPPLSVEQVRQQVRKAADRIQLQAVEKKIDLVEMKGATGTGYYFIATDPAPKPGDYKYMAQGTIQIGQLVATFTVLTNDGQKDIVTAALEMIQGATQAETKEQ